MSQEDIFPQHKHQLSGLWHCTSFKMYDPTTNTLLSEPHGERPLGRVLISPQGFLSAHIARPDRTGALPSGRAWQVGHDAEVAHVARGISMYCGRMRLFEDEGGWFWETKVEVASDPARFGGTEVRRVEYWEEDGGDGDGEGGGKRCFMVLRPKQDLILEDGTKTRAVLKWEKIEAWDA